MNIRTILLAALIPLAACTSEDKSTLIVSDLNEPVEIIRDSVGINHIYAKNQHDLFFAQGYAAAKDRLFQFEIWRRQATGTVAELLGERELKRDIGTRLFKFRGDMMEEMNYYHQDGSEIITAYVDGVNAYIEEAINENKLPVEFALLGTKPEKWTPDVVISRHQGLLGNIGQELDIGRSVATIGSDAVKQIAWFHPKEPDLDLDPMITKELLTNDILELYNAYRKPVRFKAEDLAKPTWAKLALMSGKVEASSEPVTFKDDWVTIGSNNWVVAREKTVSGNTIMANDPHRTIAVPSLRYMVHLVAPGWNVIGGGEPEIPGVSIGHNEYGAWGLTVFRTDGEDLYVYKLNPDNLNQYIYQGQWEDMKVIHESIPVKGRAPVEVDLRYTRHGPVTFIDSAQHVAFAVRCAWMEPGGAPYLASLRMDQAQTWEEFRQACNYSHIPGENMVWAGKDGDIGWQAVGIAPIRANFSGLVPVPGDGRYEWDGYLPIIEKPHSSNPASGFIGTANQHVTPPDFAHWNAIGFSWSDPFRGNRVSEVLSTEAKLSMDDMKALQTDNLSIPARTLVPLLFKSTLPEKNLEKARNYLDGWDYRLERASIAAAIYVAWENEIRSSAKDRFVPDGVKQYLTPQLTRIIEWITTPGRMFASEQERNQFLAKAFVRAIDDLTDRLGEDMSRWQYGQAKNKHITITHALGRIVNDSLQALLNLGPVPRGGNAFTTGSTGSNYNQTSGASFRIIVDTGDWDKAVGTNTPGQAGDPASPFYRNLFLPWANDQYFPVYFSTNKIEQIAAEKISIKPNKK